MDNPSGSIPCIDLFPVAFSGRIVDEIESSGIADATCARCAMY